MSISAKKGGALPKDAEGNPIQTASTFVQSDATTPTAQQSPLAVSSTELEIKIRANSTHIVIRAETDDVRFGKQDPLDGTAGNPYEVLEVGQFMSLPVADATSVYVMRHTGDLTLHYHFETL